MLAVAAAVAGCTRDRPPTRHVPVETRPRAYPQFSRPAVALVDAEWMRDVDADPAQERGRIPRGSHVLLARPDADEPAPAWTQALYHPVGVVNVQTSQFGPASFTHRTLRDTPWYDNPSQSRAANGLIVKGSDVVVVRNAGSYSEVFVANGVQGYVETAALAPLAGTR